MVFANLVLKHFLLATDIGRIAWRSTSWAWHKHNILKPGFDTPLSITDIRTNTSNTKSSQSSLQSKYCLSPKCVNLNLEPWQLSDPAGARWELGQLFYLVSFQLNPAKETINSRWLPGRSHWRCSQCAGFESNRCSLASSSCLAQKGFVCWEPIQLIAEKAASSLERSIRPKHELIS